MANDSSVTLPVVPGASLDIHSVIKMRFSLLFFTCLYTLQIAQSCSCRPCAPAALRVFLFPLLQHVYACLFTARISLRVVLISVRRRHVHLFVV